MVCFPNTFSVISWPSVTLVLILLVTVGLVTWSLRTNTQILMIPQAAPPQASTPVSQPIIQVKGGDDRYSRAPEAEREWYAPPDMSRVPDLPFNIPTQGIPESYQSLGIVKTDDGKLLPLYGRRSISSRDRYNYYTRTDTYNPMPIPVNIGGRDCQDQVGCPELFNGDKVRMSALNQAGEVTMYRVRDIIR